MAEQRTAPVPGTSWASVVGGWIAAVGAATLVAPLIAAILYGRPATPNDLAIAVPVVLGLMIAYLIGGYVAGRMAGYHTSWHGMMAAFFGLLVTLLALLAAAAAEGGLVAGVRPLSDAFPAVRQLDLRTLGDTLTFGAVLSFLVAIFAGWLGGLLAPERWAPGRAPEARAGVVVAAGSVAPAPPKRGLAPRFRLLPSIGAKGGERVEARTETPPTTDTRADRP